MSRVLVVDDEEHLADAVRHMLEAAGHEAIVAHDGMTGISLAATAAPELVVLDLGLPDMSGLDVVARLRPWFTAPVLVLSGWSDEERKVAALEAGADDYLVKPFGVRELLARVSALLRRPGSEPAEQRLRFLDLTVDLVAREVTVAGREVRLTPTEWRLLDGFVTNAGKLLTHRWLLDHAWDDAYGGETREALRVHLRGLRAKLGDDAADPRFIRTESGAGYRWLPAPDGQAEPPGLVAGDTAVDELTTVLAEVRSGAEQARDAESADDRDRELGRLLDLVDRAADLARSLRSPP